MTNKPGTRSSTVVSIFVTREQAECALEKLQAAGLNEDHYGVVMRHPEDSGESGMTTGEKVKHAGKTTATGAIAGGVIGALGRAAGALLIPASALCWPVGCSSRCSAALRSVSRRAGSPARWMA